MKMPLHSATCFMQKCSFAFLNSIIYINHMNRHQLILLLACFITFESFSQNLKNLIFDNPASFSVTGVARNDNNVLPFQYGLPLFSVIIDSNFYNSYCGKALFTKEDIRVTLADSIAVVASIDKKFQKGTRIILRFTNLGKGIHTIENLVPLGEGTDKVYISARGTREWPQYLCRSVLFRPGYGPVGVVLPDNAWSLGFSDFTFDEETSISGLARRDKRDKDKTEVDRWVIKLKPGGWAEYNLYFDLHKGDWHEGLKMMFQDRYLYDLDNFDQTMFKRQDLKWMQNTYLMLLQFAWDKKYYDATEQKYNFYNSLIEYDSLLGGFDVYTLWPTWPRLGLDQRNQFDMYRDLPGGLKELNRQVNFVHQKNKKYFISYNPWDEGTRKEDQMKGLEDLLRATNADGVVLDTRGSSSRELQAAADKVRPGIIMYSEGMAVPKDMPGIVSGRVHDALVMPPPLNLNKFIKPDFAIFRVLQLADDRLHRETAVAFFNGYGIEINTMRPGRPAWIAEEFAYMGRTTKILRENNSVFHNDRWVPLLPTLTDSIYVNKWESDDKMIFTLFSLKPEGFEGPLFEFPGIDPSIVAAPFDVNIHFVDLWNHRETDPVNQNGKFIIQASLEKFDRSWLNSRREGNVGCIGVFPVLLDVKLTNDTLDFKAKKGNRIMITGENPGYSSKSYRFSADGNTIPVSRYFGFQNEKIVFQLYQEDELLDERVIILQHNSPRLISKVVRTAPLATPPPDMVMIPGGTFRYYTKRDPATQEPFIGFPSHEDTIAVDMHAFYMDKYPVTNLQWKFFLKTSYYKPLDTINYLKNWINGNMPEGQERCPVVYISREDAKAYAEWAQKRLPTEMEWQYAAQGTDLRKYPWGNKMDSTRCNFNLNHPTPVDAYPSGASPFGVEDMIGNVWQMTNDIYDNDSYYFNIIRGGSYYHPSSSIWYFNGGPVPADHPEMLLLMGPSLDRNATVGLRCVRDAK